jgi:hypothetical protein
MAKVTPSKVVFTSTSPWIKTEKSQTLVIHCSEPTLQVQFEEFLREGLMIQQFDRLAVPGGPQFLLLASYIPKITWAGNHWLKFMVEKHNIKEIIALSHEDCSWYKELQIGPIKIPLLKERQLVDLGKINQVLRQSFPAVDTRLFHAREGPDQKVEFLEIS